MTKTPAVDPISPPLTSNYNVTQQVVASGLNQPLSFEFAPQNPSLAYVAEKSGVIKVVDVATGAQSTFIDISSKVNVAQDRGLLDIALDPQFGQPNHSYVYAFYVVDPPDTAANTGNAGTGRRRKPLFLPGALHRRRGDQLHDGGSRQRNHSARRRRAHPCRHQRSRSRSTVPAI